MTTIPPEIDNEDCKRALRHIRAKGRVALNDVQDPIETGALLWHGLLDVDGDVFSVSDKGRLVLETWGAT